MRFAEAGMRVLALCLGLALLLSVAPGSATQNAPTDAKRSEAAAVPDTLAMQSGTEQLAPHARGATVAAPRAATMAIAPEPAIDSGDEMFVGTGDGSNGFWVQP